MQQTLDTIVSSFSQHLAEQFGRQVSETMSRDLAAQHQHSGQGGPPPHVEVKVQVVPLPTSMHPAFLGGRDSSTGECLNLS